MQYASASAAPIVVGAPSAWGDRQRHIVQFLPAASDMLAVAVCVVINDAIITALTGFTGVSVASVTAAGAFAALVLHTCLGAYGTGAPGPIERFRLRVLAALMLPWLVAALVGLGTPAGIRTLALLLGASAASIPVGLLFETQLRRVLIARSLWGSAALLIGTGEATARITTYLLDHPEIGLRPVGFVGDAAVGVHSYRIPYLGALSDAPRLAGAAEIAVVAPSADLDATEIARLPFRRVLIVPDVAPAPALWLRSRAIGSTPAIEFKNRAHHVSAIVLKRVLDVVIGLPLLLLSLPVILLLAVAVKIASPGPAFYVQRRAGWNGREINIIKIRTMFRDAEQKLAELLARDEEARAEWQRHVKLRHDPRVIPIIGNLLRRTSLDELPQLWNVLRGDISLVGPRPFPSYHLQLFPAEFRRLRESVRPGLTGFWQVSDRSDANIEVQQVLDTFYITNWSLWLDLYIILQTLPALLNARGAR